MFQMSDTEGQFKSLDAVEIDFVTGQGSITDEEGHRSDVTRLYEAKLIHQFDHRFATFAGQTKPRGGGKCERNLQGREAPILFRRH